MGGGFFWLIVIVVLGAVIGFAYGLGKKGKEGAAKGAVDGAVWGASAFMTILWILLPLIIIIALFKACS